jgi:hypothetical protein
MLAPRLLGVYALIPTTMLLVVSFFVLFSLRKVEKEALKGFGYVLAALLWVSALLVFSAGIYTVSTGRCPLMKGMKGMMKDKMHCREMMQGKMRPLPKGMEMPAMPGKMEER